MFQLNSWIPLVRSSSELVVHCAREKDLKDLSFTPPKDLPEGLQILPQTPLEVATLVQRTLVPTLRDNPFPEVMDLFFQLILSTLIYQLEAANFEDLHPLLNLGSPGTLHTCKNDQPDYATYTTL